jgi:hypothetical protein
MALVFTKVPDGSDVWGKTRTELFDVTLDTSYPTGGTTITPANVGMRTIHSAECVGGNAASKVLMYAFDTTTTPGSAKLLCLFPSGGGAAAPTTVVDPALTGGAVAVTSAAANGAADLTPGQGKEVGNTANLSALVVRIRFYGN